MAITLPTKTVSFSLGNAVSARLESFRKASNEAQQAAELDFYQQTSKGMSYADQLAFRQGQLEKETKRDVPDQDYILGLKKEVSGIKKLVANERLKNAYLASFTKLATGMQSFQEHISFLQNELNDASDPDQKELLNGYLSTAQQNQYKQEQTISDNYVQYALNDKTVSVLEKAIDTTSAEKSKALGNGDAGRASALNLKIQALNQKLTETNIENSIHQFVITKLKSYNPADYLNSINDKIGSAKTDSAVTYNGQTYANEKEFWLAQKSDYFNSGQFDAANTKYWNDVVQMNYNNSQITFPTQLKQVASQINSLLNRPDLADFKNVIAGSNSTILANATDKAAKTILDNVDVTYDFQNAADKLAQLSKDTGIDQSNNYTALLGKTSQIKSGEVNLITDQAQVLKSQGMTEQQALQTAINQFQAGKLGVTVSPEKTATQPVEKTAADASGQGTSKPAAPLKTPANLQSYNEGDLIKSANNATVYKFEGGKLRAIGGSENTPLTESQFQQNLGKSFSDVKQVDNISNIGLPMGENLIVNNVQPKLYKAKVGQRYGSYAPETEFVLEGSTLRPISSQQAKQKVAPGAVAQEVDTSFFNDKKLGGIY